MTSKKILSTNTYKVAAKNPFGTEIQIPSNSSSSMSLVVQWAKNYAINDDSIYAFTTNGIVVNFFKEDIIGSDSDTLSPTTMIIVNGNHITFPQDTQQILLLLKTIAKDPKISR